MIEYKNKQIKNRFYTKEGVLDKTDVEEIELQNIGKGETKYFPNDCNISVVWAKVYKKEFLENNNLVFIEGIKRMPDTIFNMLAFEKAQNIKCCDIYEYHYRINKNSITQNYDENIINDINIFLEEVDNYIKQFNKNNRFKNTYYIAILVKIIQIYEIYIYNNKVKELEQFIKSKQYNSYLKKLNKISIEKINLYQKLMLKAIKNKKIFIIKILTKIKKFLKKFQNKCGQK